MPHSTALLFILLCLINSTTRGTEIAITMDDPNGYETPLLSPTERDQRIRNTLNRVNLKAVLFACGMRIDNRFGHLLLQKWSDSGHWIANHSYTHFNYNRPEKTPQELIADLERAETLLAGFPQFIKWFRFPFLKEGDSVVKRDTFRNYLKQRGYKVGAVTIDASDWYIDQRLNTRLLERPNADLEGYRRFYLEHLWARAIFYDGLAKKLLGKSPSHTLLIHHNLLNALFLPDVIQAFKNRGWKWVNAARAYQDSIYEAAPESLPAGESLLWAMARASGKFESQLRYPGEDGSYEVDEMDARGL